MEPSPKIQAVISQLMEKYEAHFYHAPNYSRLTLLLDGFPDLRIMVYGQTVSVAHTVDVNGFISDPEVLFSTHDAKWVPIGRSFYVSPYRPWNPMKWESGGMVDLAYALPFTRTLPGWQLGQKDHFEPVMGMEHKQIQEARLCEEWADKLVQQGWLERAHKA